jgi:hypothetical protein
MKSSKSLLFIMLIVLSLITIGNVEAYECNSSVFYNCSISNNVVLQLNNSASYNMTGIVTNIITFGNNITLDCNNSLLFSNKSATGFFMASRNGIIIKNCVLSRFNKGISGSTIQNIQLINITINESIGNDIWLYNATNTNLTNIFIKNISSISAINIFGDSNNVIVNNLVANKSTFGNQASSYIIDFDNLSSSGLGIRNIYLINSYVDYNGFRIIL